MARQDAGELVIPERLDVPRRSEVPGLPISSGQRVVRHLADQRLHECVLATLRTAWIGLQGEQLAPDQAPKPRLDGVIAEPGDA